MADNNIKVESRFLSYNKAEVEALLGKVEHADAEPTPDSENMISSGAVAAALTKASEENVRNIVRNYASNTHSES